MSSGYWLGLATLPAVALVLFIVYQIIEVAGATSNECMKCGKIWRPWRFEPRWLWAARRRWLFRNHMRDSRPCRERVNRWRRESVHGDGGKWFA